VRLTVPVTGATVTGVTASAGTCSNTASQLTCDIASLPSGSTVTVRIDVNAPSAGTAQAVATTTFSGTDSVAANDSATATTTISARPSASSSSGGSSGGGGGGGGGGRFDWLVLAFLSGLAFRHLAAGRLVRKPS
jgi:hypothetical protein